MDLLPPNDNSQTPPQPVLAHHCLSPNWAFSAFTLIGISFFIFEFFFLILYSSDFWFNFNIHWWGAPTVVLALLLGHLLLTFNESKLGCQFFYPLKKGVPLFIYRKWVQLDESGIIFGNRHLLWSPIDEVNLNFWGTLAIKSKSLFGPRQSNLDVVLKLPFTAGTAESQQKFLKALLQARPDVKMNQGLEKRLQIKYVKGTATVQLLGVIYMLLVLLDLGHSTFSYLEMLKEYYLCQTDARDGKQAEAKAHFQLAEQFRKRPVAFSLVSKLLGQGKIAAGVFEARSDAQWYLGNKTEAIASLKQALQYNPISNRLNLHLIRDLNAIGNYEESISQIQSATKNHPNTLVPRLYMISSLVAHQDNPSAKQSYDKSMNELRDSVFGQEPLWPPGGNRFIDDLFYQDDITFIFDKLLNCPHKPTQL